jgi:zinc finger protein
MEEIKTDTRCPNCNEFLFYLEADNDIPYEGKITIHTYICKNCSYRNVTIERHDKEEPKIIKFKIKNKNDLKTIVYRSPDASVQIPELDAEISPGIASTGYITTVEGILTSIKEKLTIMGDGEDVNYLRQRIDGILSGAEEKITIIIDDDSGKSKINSSRAEVNTKE